MSSSNVDPMKKSSIYATFGKYYGEKLYKLLYDCCSGLPGSFCYEVLKCLGISSQGDSNLVLNQQGSWVENGENSWNISGNAGTDSNNNFIGTTDEEDFVIRTNNIEAARIYANQGFKFTTEIGNGEHELSCRDNNVFGASVFTQRYVDNVANYTTLISNGDASPYGGGTSDLTLSCFKNDFSEVASLDVHRDAFGNPTIFGSSRIGGNLSEFGVSSEQGVKMNTQSGGQTRGFVADFVNGFKVNDAYILPDGDGSSGQVLKTDGAGVVSWSSLSSLSFNLNSYATDADADADTNLPSGGLYKLNTGRAIYQKP